MVFIPSSSFVTSPDSLTCQAPTARDRHTHLIDEEERFRRDEDSIQAGVPAEPVTLATDAWGNGKRFEDFGKIDPLRKAWFEFGRSMTITGRGDEEPERISAFISGKLKEWGGTLPAEAGRTA